MSGALRRMQSDQEAPVQFINAIGKPIPLTSKADRRCTLKYTARLTLDDFNFSTYIKFTRYSIYCGGSAQVRCMISNVHCILRDWMNVCSVHLSIFDR